MSVRRAACRRSTSSAPSRTIFRTPRAGSAAISPARVRFAVDADFVWVGTDSGASRSARRSCAVRRLRTGLQAPVFALEILNGVVYAGTRVGVFTFDEASDAWIPLNCVGCPPPPVPAQHRRQPADGSSWDRTPTCSSTRVVLGAVFAATAADARRPAHFRGHGGAGRHDLDLPERSRRRRRLLRPLGHRSDARWRLDAPRAQRAAAQRGALLEPGPTARCGPGRSAAASASFAASSLPSAMGATRSCA